MKTGQLLERETEIERLVRALDYGAAGSGTSLVLEGPAGIGKSALLAMAAERAATNGLTVARAVGGSLERDLPFNAVRQLLEPIVLDCTWDEQATLFGGAAAPAAPLLGPAAAIAAPTSGQEMADDVGTTLHALFWLVSNLADRNPLLLVADDAQWFDPPSLRFMAYLARRLTDLPAALLLATRPPEPGPSGDLLRDLVSDQGVQHIPLQPLSDLGVTALVKHRLGEDAEDGFCTACADAARGNPFMTLTLLEALAEADVEPHDEAASAVVEIGGPRCRVHLSQPQHGRALRCRPRARRWRPDPRVRHLGQRQVDPRLARRRAPVTHRRSAAVARSLPGRGGHRPVAPPGGGGTPVPREPPRARAVGPQSPAGPGVAAPARGLRGRVGDLRGVGAGPGDRADADGTGAHRRRTSVPSTPPPCGKPSKSPSNGPRR